MGKKGIKYGSEEIDGRVRGKEKRTDLERSENFRVGSKKEKTRYREFQI